MAPRWENALDAQMELSAKLGSDRITRRLTRNFLHSFYTQAHDNPDVPGRRDLGDLISGVNLITTDGSETPGVIYTGHDLEEIVDQLAVQAYNADTIHVDDDMMTIWEGMLSEFEAEPLMPQDLIAPAGFLWLPRPYASKDAHGKVVTTRAVMWHPFTFRVRPTATGEFPFAVPPTVMGQEPADGERYLDFNDVPNDGTRYIQSVFRKTQDDVSGKYYFETEGIMLSLWHSTQDPDQYDDENMKRLNLPSGLYLGHVVPWPYRSNWGSVTRDHDKMPDSIFAWQALWRLMQQKLAGRVEHRPDRPTRKRMLRAKWAERNVTVIRLRRVEPPAWHEGDPTGPANYSHRFTVRRHWKWQ
jgi:hypothetical protein